MKEFRIAIAAAALLAFLAPASAQTTAPSKAAPTTATTTAAPTTKAPTAKQQRTAKSLECSKQADAKQIHGKERRKFMRSCNKA